MKKIRISLVIMITMLSFFKIMGWSNQKTTLITFCVCSLIMLLLPFKQEEAECKEQEIMLTGVVSIIYVLLTLSMIII